MPLMFTYSPLGPQAALGGLGCPPPSRTADRRRQALYQIPRVVHPPLHTPAQPLDVQERELFKRRIPLCCVYSGVGGVSLDYRHCWKQCSGSVTFWYGSGSLDAYRTPAPVLALFVSDFQDAKKFSFFANFFAYYFLQEHLHKSVIKWLRIA
jgi:hypothetical protein